MLQVYLADILMASWNENQNRVVFLIKHGYFYMKLYSLEPCKVKGYFQEHSKCSA